MRLGPIRLSIHPLFWLFAAVIGLFYGQNLAGVIIWVVIVFVSVLVHELGHALTGLLFKQRVHIQLVLFGGITYRDGPKISLPKEFLLTFNGPLFGYALAGISWACLVYIPGLPYGAAYPLERLFYINLFWSTLNLLPILPLDGGHLLRILCEGIFGHKGTSYALFVGVVLGAALAVFFLINKVLIIGALFLMFAFESFRGWKTYRNITPADKRQQLQDLYKEAHTAWKEGIVDHAVELFEQVREQAKTGMLYNKATEAVGDILAQSGEEERAYRLLVEVQRHISPSSMPILQRLAYRAEDYDRAIVVGKESFQYTPNYKVAWVCALAHAAKRQVKPAIGWLECAMREGLTDVDSALHDKQFDKIRQHPKFMAFQEKISG